MIYKKVIIITILLRIFFFHTSMSAKSAASVNYLPQTPAYSQYVSTFSYEGVSQGVRLAAVSLQGLVNRDTARIYLSERQSRWLLDFYKERGVVKDETVYNNIFTLLKEYKNFF